MLGAFVLLFLIVALFHTRLENRLHRLQIWRNIKQTHLGRLQLDWNMIPSPNESMVSRTMHPYAEDLDLIGHQSLLHLLDVTLSLNGSKRLQQWLLGQHEEALSFEEWEQRQQLVREASSLTRIYDRMALASCLVSTGPFRSDRIEKLLAEPIRVSWLLPTLLLSTGLALTNLGLVVLSTVFGFPEYWTLSLSAYLLLYFAVARDLGRVFGRSMLVHHELQKLGAILQVLEKHPLTSTPHLQRLCDELVRAPWRPSAAIRHLARLCQGLSVKAHPLVHIGVNVVGPWDLWLVFQLQRHIRRLRENFPQWLDCLATFDAAAALGMFAYLHPSYAWPVRKSGPQDDEGGVVARSLAHPLLPFARRVANDVKLLGKGTVLLVTGSNMSGKSTFLRTVGLNVCLAQAGAPVCATSLEWSWMRVWCCIRVMDSLAQGVSFFYAEVKRLKSILEALQQPHLPPVLFLIDEIFKGTNNRERLIGSEAYIRALTKGNGLGLITTHDLELAQLERDIPQVQNVHFQETLKEATLTFDYRLRPGPCPTTNALRIMAHEGLPVPLFREQHGKCPEARDS
ncbi:MAG: hypothetical protein D6704_12585 [Nitrospirae bacterium]|nr:MAG: hypothetical protein D6704_12585 [Nitrospirota bacterium]